MKNPNPHTNQINPIWVLRYYEKAKLVSSYSKDPSSKVGAVVCNDDLVELVSGWNGFPRGILDIDARYNDREVKYKLVVHAERNAILNACRVGISTMGSAMFVYGVMTCHECAKDIIQCGIDRVYMLVDGEPRQVWYESFNYTSMMFTESRVYYQMDQVIGGSVLRVQDNIAQLQRTTLYR